MQDGTAGAWIARQERSHVQTLLCLQSTRRVHASDRQLRPRGWTDDRRQTWQMSLRTDVVVVLVVRLSGTQTGAWRGLPGTGRRFDAPASSTARGRTGVDGTMLCSRPGSAAAAD